MNVRFRNSRVSPSLLLGLRVGDLLAICREHQVPVPSDAREVDLIRAIMRHPEEFDVVVSSEAGEARWPEVEVLGGNKLSGAQPKTRSFLKYDMGRLVGLPRYRSVQKGTETNLRTGETDETVFPTIGGGFIGSMRHSSGDQFAFPADALYLARLPKGGTKIEQFLPSRNPRQLRGGAEVAGGWVLCSRYTKDRTMFAFHPETKASRAVPYEASELFHANRGTHWHWGVVSNGYDALVLPWGSDYAGFYDGKRDQLSFIPDLMQGGDVAAGNRQLYSHGDYDETTNKACSIGRHARHVLVFDFGSRELNQVPFPRELVEALRGRAACFGQKFGPDGWLYAAPFGSLILIRFNPHTGEIQWRDLEEELKGKVNLHPQGEGQGWFTAVFRDEDALFFGAGGSDRMVRLNFEG